MPYKRREDQAAAAAKHYKENKKKIISRSSARNKRQKKKNKEFVYRVKRRYNCVDCGESNPIVLEFDHVRGEKKKAIADMVVNYYSIKTIKEEMRKCEIRCANCHRIKTSERKNKLK
jgi:hypothetical protein|tara:strand:+ start:208 stop:558 length:351 start_codon:yes stop_codon:yes gene_type:complete